MNTDLQYVTDVTAKFYSAGQCHGEFSIVRVVDGEGGTVSLFINHPNHAAIATAMAEAWRRETHPVTMRPVALEDFGVRAAE